MEGPNSREKYINSFSRASQILTGVGSRCQFMKVARLKTFAFSLLWPVGVVFGQMTFGYVASFPLNLSLFVLAVTIPVLMFLTAHRLPWVVFALLIVVYALLILLLYPSNPVDFAKSFGQILLFLATLSIAFSVRMPPIVFGRMIRITLVLAAASALLIMMQAFIWNLGYTETLSRPMGAFQPLGPGGDAPYSANPYAPIKRSNGLYSEPSIAGWMMGFFYALAICSFRRISFSRRWSYFLIPLFMAAALSTGSLSGFLSVAAVSIVWALGKSYRRGSFIAPTLGGLFMMALAFLVAISWSGEVMKSRIENMSEPGTAIYYRVFAPLQLLGDSLPAHPFGHSLGSDRFIAEKTYMINWAGGSSTNIDNSAFLVAYYFGLPGVVGVIVSLWYLVRKLFCSHVSREMSLAMALALLSTGALWSPFLSLFLGSGLLLSRGLEVPIGGESTVARSAPNANKERP